MNLQSLFGGRMPPMHPPQPTQPTILYSCKAGKLEATPISNAEGGEKYRVVADPRRGLIVLERGVDGALHFIWRDRSSTQVLLNFLIFPGDQTLESVDTGRGDKDRVYLLTFKTSSTRRFFFWMQDVDATKDEERVKQLNRIMNEPPPPPSQTGRAPGGGGGLGRNRNAGMLFGGPISNFGGASSSPFVGGTTASGGAVNLNEQLDSILSGMGFGAGPTSSTTTTSSNNNSTTAPTGASSSSSATTTSGAGISQAALDAALRNLTGGASDSSSSALTPSINNVVTSESLLAALLEDEEIKQRMLSLLPEGRQTEEELRVTCSSPQLAQAMRELSKALSGDADGFNTILASFGLNPAHGAEAINRGDAVGAFLMALQKSVRDEEEEKARKRSEGGGGGQ